MKHRGLLVSAFLLLTSPWILGVFGMGLNQAVIEANGGAMPVYIAGGCTQDDLDGPRHKCMTADSHLKFLADRFRSADYIYSVGDVFIEAGSLLDLPTEAATILILGILVILERKKKVSAGAKCQS
jgi:hypothetical protein